MIFRIKFHDYARNTQGAFGPITAIIVLILISVAGFTIDLAFNMDRRSELQHAVDSAVLAGVKEATREAAEAAARATFEANFHYKPRNSSGVTQSEGDDGLKGASPESSSAPVLTLTYTKSEAAINLKAVAEYNSKNAFGGIIGLETTKLSVSAAAQIGFKPKISGLTMIPKKASGVYHKDIKLWVIPENSKTAENRATITWRWSGNSAYEGQLNATPKGPVKVLDAAYVYFTFHNRGTSYWSNVNTSWRSDDPDHSHSIGMNGKMFPKGIKLDIFGMLKCDQREDFEYEDGGGGHSDFFFDIIGECAEGGELDMESIRLAS